MTSLTPGPEVLCAPVRAALAEVELVDPATGMDTSVTSAWGVTTSMNTWSLGPTLVGTVTFIWYSPGNPGYKPANCTVPV